MNLLDERIVVFDTETTGLKPAEGHRICEIAAIQFYHGREIARYSTLVNPGRACDPGATRAHGITDEMLGDAPPFAAVRPIITELVSWGFVVGWNVEFDVQFLRAEYARTDYCDPISHPVIDALRLARKQMPRQWPYKLDAVHRALCLPPFAGHRALADAEACAAVFHRLLATVDDHESIPWETIR